MTRKTSLRAWVSTWAVQLHQDRCGATATEYLLVMALVVLPIGLLMPLFLGMARVYGARVISLMGLPFP